MSRYIFNQPDDSELVVRFENAIEDLSLCVLQGDLDSFDKYLAELVHLYVIAINDCGV